jgi:hypothetical protein
MLDLQVIDELFQRPDNPGYVLNFSDRTFAIFLQELNVDIDDPIYSKDGTSKLWRLKCDLRTVENAAATEALKSLWDYRERRRQGREDRVANAHGRFLQLLQRIGGKLGGDTGEKPRPALDCAKWSHIRRWYQRMQDLPSARSASIFRKDLIDLRHRSAATRWPGKEPVTDDSQDVSLAIMRELVRHWQTDYDWRKVEARLNALPQFITEIDRSSASRPTFRRRAGQRSAYMSAASPLLASWAILPPGGFAAYSSCNIWKVFSQQPNQTCSPCSRLRPRASRPLAALPPSRQPSEYTVTSYWSRGAWVLVS